MVNGPTHRRAVVITALALAVLVLLSYQGHRSAGFVSLDDPEYVSDNPWVRDGLTPASVRWALTATRAGNWHPLTWISHQLDVSLFGLNPTGHHATNLALHTATTLLLFAVLHGMTGQWLPSLLAAALFGVHPVRVESVAWVAERKDVLSGLFFALCLAAYHKTVRTRRLPWYVLLCALFALGLASKATLVTLPFVLLILDYWPLGRLDGHRALLREALIEKAPLVLLAAASGAITFLAQRTAGAMDNPATFTLAARFSNALLAYVGYLGKTVWPARLAVFYPFRSQVPAWEAIAAGLLLAILTVGALRLARTHGYLAAGWLWFAGMLIPMSGLVQVGGQALADRYLYLPGVGLCIAAAWGVNRAAAARRGRWRAWVWGAAAAIVVVLAVRTAFQVRFWQDSMSLYRHALAVEPDNFLIRTNLGVEYERQGRLDEAEREYRLAIGHNPGFGPAWRGLGVLEGNRGRYRKAAEFLERSVQLRPGDPLARVNLGLALEKLGRTAGAVAQYEEALRLDPGNRRAAEYLAQARWRNTRIR